jgi:hypothetical protein
MYAYRLFPRIPRQFCVPQTAQNLPNSQQTVQYISHILGIRRKNEGYAERNSHFQQCLGTWKSHLKKMNWKLNTGVGWKVYKYNCLSYISFKLLSAYMENTHNAKNEVKLSTSQLIYNGQPWKKLKIFSFCTRWAGLSQKTFNTRPLRVS